MPYDGRGNDVGLTAEAIEAAAQIVGDVAKDHGMKRAPDLPSDLLDMLRSGEFGFDPIVEYQMFPDGLGGRAVLLFVHVYREKRWLTVTIRDLGTGESTATTRQLRAELERKLREAFPDRQIEFNEAAIDASFAP